MTEIEKEGEKKYDFAIIGGGLGGLIVAQILSKEGKSVIVLEKNKHLGGVIQGFKRHGVTFDTGAHYIGGFEPGQNLYQYFKYLEIHDKLVLESLSKEGFDRFHFAQSGKTYSYGQGYDNFVEILSQDFPEHRAAIQKYVDEIRKVGEYYHLYSLKPVDQLEQRLNFDHIYKSVKAFMDEITTDPELRRVLLASNLVYAGDEEVTPWYIHALILNSYIQSSHRFVGGASQMALQLALRIRERGNDVITKAEVIGFNFGEGRNIQSVQLQDGTQVFADNFISNMHPSTTMKMIPPDRIRKTFRERILNMKNTYSIFSVYLVLKPDSFPNLDHNLYFFREDKIWNLHQDIKQWPPAFMMLTQTAKPNEKYASGITSICPMNYEWVKKWESSNLKNRPQEYYEFKEEMLQRYLDVLESYYPGLRDNIIHAEANTPLTYYHYTHTPEGSLYGIIHDSNDPLRTHIAPATKIPNLSLVGQNIDVHGVLGVTVGSFMAAGLHLNLENLIDQVRNA